jgi:hypothetical protein
MKKKENMKKIPLYIYFYPLYFVYTIIKWSW